MRTALYFGLLAAWPAWSSSDRVVYVHGARGGGGDGRAWSTAYASLHPALEDAARDGAEIWVAAGTYRPSERDRAVSFVLRPGVKLYGGFTGSETARERRDPAAHPAVLSGEIGDPLLPEDNSYHVLIGAEGAVLDGFTITGGYADGLGYDGQGGGLINYRHPPVAAGFSTVVRNAVFTGNYARDGGAVYTYGRAKPRFERCVFRGNRAVNGGAVVDRMGVEAVYQDCEFRGNRAGGRGGAAYFDDGARPSVTGTRWQSNYARGDGGAIYSAGKTVVTLERCRFEDNTAWGDGGAAAFDDASAARATTCQFAINRALGRGGAVAVTNRSSLEVDGVRFGGNSAPNGPDVYRDPARAVR